MSCDVSVLTLVSELCKKYSTNYMQIRKLRSRAYEILLNKCPDKLITKWRDLDPNNPYSNCLAWQYTLVTEYGLPEHGFKIREALEKLEAAYGSNSENFNSILSFLMGLREIPNIENDDLDLEFAIPEKHYHLLDLKKPVSPQAGIQWKDTVPCDLDIWQIALTEKYIPRKTWESLGIAEPEQELPFLSELYGQDSQLVAENTPSFYIKSVMDGKALFKPDIKTLDEFICDLKHLLVGLASSSFIYDTDGKFILAPNVSVIGVLPHTLLQFVGSLIQCGQCFKALDTLCTPNFITGNLRHDGYVFNEFCENLHRYMDYYRNAIFKLPSKRIALTAFCDRNKALCDQIFALASICHVGLFYTDQQMPYGVKLLNKIYQKLLDVAKPQTTLVLYTLLYPCCQVYFKHFLRHWIIDGQINDQHDEFFIKPNHKYTSTRGRTYWTRSFFIKEDLIPEFLLDLSAAILACGRSVNLLKLCCPMNPIFTQSRQHSIVQCCISSNQINTLKYNTMQYYKDYMIALGSEPFSMDQYVRTRVALQSDLLSLIVSKRATTLKRIEMEQIRKYEETRKKKHDEFAVLREQYQKSMQQKHEQREKEAFKEQHDLQLNLEDKLLRQRILREESENIISYYENLDAIIEKRKSEINKRTEAFVEERPAENLYPSTAEVTIHTHNNTEGALLEDIINDNVQDVCTNKSVSVCIDNATNLNNNVEITQTIKVLSADAEAVRNRFRNESSNVNNFYSTRVHNAPIESNSQAAKIADDIPAAGIVYEKTVAQLTAKFRLQLKPVDNLGCESRTTSLPMSIDSTPITDETPKEISSTVKLLSVTGNNSHDKQIANALLTRNAYEQDDISPNFDYNNNRNNSAFVTPNCLKLFLNESMLISLRTQTQIVDNELLCHFVNTLHFIDHLDNLRSIFLMQDGQFCRHFTDNLFHVLYENVSSLSARTMQKLIIDSTIHMQPKQLHHYHQSNGESLGMINTHQYTKSRPSSPSSCVNIIDHLSFKLITPPLDAIASSTCDNFSLIYKVPWPLNILLPLDSINKYDEIFKYLLKLHRVSWILNNCIFMDLKLLAKQTGKREIYLMSSPHYRCVHQFRHQMLHFVQTLQSYIVTDVLDPSWEHLMRTLRTIHNLDQLHDAHVAYLKNILALCMLSQKATPLRKIIDKTLVVILKFFDYLRSAPWELSATEGVYVHPNFYRLESIFANFQDLLMFFIRTGKKMSRRGYRPHLCHFIDMLDINSHYATKLSTFQI